jgi:hypothetical protein
VYVLMPSSLSLQQCPQGKCLPPVLQALLMARAGIRTVKQLRRLVWLKSWESDKKLLRTVFLRLGIMAAVVVFWHCRQIHHDTSFACDLDLSFTLPQTVCAYACRLTIWHNPYQVMAATTVAYFV